jgi:hypothetical protein
MLVPFVLLPLAACASSDVIEGIRDNGATTLMLTGRPADQVAACMGEKLQVSATNENSAYVLTTRDARPVTYRVFSITDKLNRYATEVDQIGSEPANSPILSNCILYPSLDQG